MKHKFCLFLASAACLCLTTPLRAYAQAFETLTLRVDAVQPLRQPLADGWHEGAGASASAEMPFYAGWIEIGATVHRHARQQTGIPLLATGLLYVGWSASVRISGRLRASAGPRLGMYVMRFDDDRLHPQSEVEQELAGYVVGRLDASIVDRWTARISIFCGTVMLSEPVRQTYAGIGLGYRLSTPDWLRDALK